MMKRLGIPAVILLGLLLSGCGGGSGGGSTDSRTEITSANAQELAISATSAMARSVDGDSFNPYGARSAAKTMARLAANPTVDTSFCGTIEAGSTGSLTTLVSVNSVSLTFACVNPTLSGVFAMQFLPSFDNWTSLTATFNNFTDGSDTLNGSFQCSRPNSTSLDIACSYSFSGLAGIDGGSFSISGTAITGNNFSGYNGSVTITDNDLGSITITANNIIFDDSCSFEVPVSGTLTLAGSNGSTATVTYNDCNSATVLVDGSSILVTWTDVTP